MKSAQFRLDSNITWQYRLVLAIGITAVFVLIGPFGTFEGMQFGTRLTYWFVKVGVADVVVSFTHRLTDPRLNGQTRLHRLLFRAFIFIVVYAPITWLWSCLFESRLMSPMGFGFFLLNDCALTIVLFILAYYLCSDEADFIGQHPQLYDRLVDKTSAGIIRLAVNDHFVEVFLDDGTTQRLRMRLSDAVREMDHAPGFCTHRSHWVSRTHIVKAVKEDGREFVVLTDGAKVPVSKTYRENVQAAGFV